MGRRHVEEASDAFLLVDANMDGVLTKENAADCWTSYSEAVVEMVRVTCLVCC